MNKRLLLPLLLVGGCIDDTPDEATTTSDLDQTPISGSTYDVNTLTLGTGWRRLAISGSLYDPASATLRSASDRAVIVIDDPAQISSSPLPATVKTSLTERTNTLLAAGRQPPVWVVDEVAAQQVEDYATTTTTPSTTYSLTGCSDQVKTFSQDISDGASKSADLTNLGFSGDAGKFEVSATFGIRSEETLTIVRADTVFGCIPYSASLERVALTGYGDASARFTLDSSSTSTVTGRWRKELGKVELAPIGFWVGPLPVVLRVAVPFEAGIDATNAGTTDIDVTFAEHLTAGVTCDLDDKSCTTSSTASHDFTSNAAPTGSTTSRAYLTPWARASLRVALYDDHIAYAQIGLRPRATADFWSYAGSSCGDGNGDGANEYVRALTLDATMGLDLSATIAVVGRQVWEHNWPLGSGLHVAFWDIYPGGSSALRPIFYDTAITGSLIGGPTVTVTGRMRPCWPYADSMKYRVDWTDGSTTSLTKAPATWWSTSHNFAYGGDYTLRLTATQDAAGRRLNKVTTHAVSLPGLLPPVLEP